MKDLIESKLQKTILLLGGIVIFLRLSDVNYYKTYTALLQSLGIAILTFVLLVLTKGYKPEIHRKIFRLIKKYWVILVLIAAVILAFYAYAAYAKYLTNQQFHKSEIAYQNCLDKAAAQNNEVQSEVASYKASIPTSGYVSPAQKPSAPGVGVQDPFANLGWIDPYPAAPVPTQQYQNGINQIQQKSYFSQWEQANRPGYDPAVGFWEVGFMNWMMQNNPNFCSEFNPSSIKSFITQKMAIINKTSSN